MNTSGFQALEAARASRTPQARPPAKSGLLHIALDASAGERTCGSYHIQNFNADIARLEPWMAHFKGVATKCLASYLG